MEQQINKDTYDDAELDDIASQVNQIVEQEEKIYLIPTSTTQSGIAPSIILECLNSNEDGDARLFIELHKNRFCFDHSIERWFKWRGHYWKEDLVGEVYSGFDAIIAQYAKETTRQCDLRIAAAKINQGKDEPGKVEKKLLDRIRDLQTLYRKKNVLILASRGTHALGITGNEWDRNPWLLGCSNGVIDLKTGELRRGDATDFIKTVSPTEWKGLNEPASVWERFLMDILAEDREKVEYLQRVFGYAITGLTTEHFIPILWGSHGRNGKGTLLETIKSVLGLFAGPIPAEMLLNDGRVRSSAGPSPDIMLLRGRRIAWASETEEGRRLAVEKVKLLTGADTLTGRAPHAKYIIEFRPSHTLFLLTNHKPGIPANDYAMWDRVHLVSFALSFVDEPEKLFERKRDPLLPEKLKQEASGILAWLVRGCLEWQRIGLNPPDSVKQATAQYREDEDILGLFVSECTAPDSSENVRAIKFYGAYKKWCEMFGHKHLGGKKFGERISELFPKESDAKGKYYKGIYLTAYSDDEPPITGYAD